MFFLDSHHPLWTITAARGVRVLPRFVGGCPRYFRYPDALDSGEFMIEGHAVEELPFPGPLFLRNPTLFFPFLLHITSSFVFSSLSSPSFILAGTLRDSRFKDLISTLLGGS
jgi:hypothetical protein